MDLRPRLAVLLAAGAVAGVVAGAAGCAGTANQAARPDNQAQPKAQPKGLEELARATGCSVQVQTNATELRQGACKTNAGRYTVLTFPTDKAAATWLSEAKIWGGTYLVGPRWVIVGTPQQLTGFQAQVGGTVQNGESHSQ